MEHLQTPDKWNPFHSAINVTVAANLVKNGTIAQIASTRFTT